MADQEAIVRELMRRRANLSPEKAAIVDELAKRMNLAPATAAVPGMEKLGGAPPAPAWKPPTPAGLQKGSDAPQWQRDAYEAKFGMPAPETLGTAFREPAQEMKTGVLEIGSGSDVLGGASKVLRGAMGVLSGPESIAPAAVAAPWRLALGLMAGTVAGRGVEGGMRLIGAPEGAAALAGDAAALAAGGKASTLEPRSVVRVPNSLMPSVVPKHPVAAMIKAIKPYSRNTEFPRYLELSLPEIKASEAELGRPIAGVDDMLEALKLAKKRVWGQREQFSGAQRAMGSQVDFSPVADAMEKSIPAKLKLENPEAAARIMETANKYRRKFSIDEAEEILKGFNAELGAYYAKYPTAQRTATTANPDTAQLVAGADAARKSIYRLLDAPGSGAGPHELGKRYGALLNMEHELYRRANVAARQQPESLSTQLGYWSGTGNIIGAGVKALTGNLAGAAVDVAKGMAERKAAQWIRNQQTTDAIIRTTMANYTRQPMPITPPRPVRPAGLLGPGPIVTPPPADASYVRGVPAMPYPPNPARALPPPSDIITPPPADTSYVRGVPAQYGEKPKPGMPRPSTQFTREVVEHGGEKAIVEPGKFDGKDGFDVTPEGGLKGSAGWAPTAERAREIAQDYAQRKSQDAARFVDNLAASIAEKKVHPNTIRGWIRKSEAEIQDRAQRFGENADEVTRIKVRQVRLWKEALDQQQVIKNASSYRRGQ